MTRLPSPSSRSSSETSFTLNLASSLEDSLQAESSQLSATNCAVLPDSAPLGIGIPSLLPSLAEEGLVSALTEKIFGVVVIIIRCSWCN